VLRTARKMRESADGLIILRMASLVFGSLPTSLRRGPGMMPPLFDVLSVNTLSFTTAFFGVFGEVLLGARFGIRFFIDVRSTSAD
jgi:hypothetical protein